MSKKYCETARSSSALTNTKPDGVNDLYDKVLFASTNGEDVLRSAINVLSTVSNILKASNNMFHLIHQKGGETHTAMKISADLKIVSKNVDRLQAICENKKSILNNFEQLSTVCRKVSIMEMFIEEGMQSRDYRSEDTGSGSDNNGTCGYPNDVVRKTPGLARKQPSPSTSDQRQVVKKQKSAANTE